jgi:putative flippase GtrA
MVKFARYFVVGTIAFVVDLGCLLLLIPHTPLLIANTVAFLLANLVNFALAHVWVFRQPIRNGHLARQYAAVLLVSVLGLAINDAMVWLGVIVVGATPIVSKVIATFVTLVWNYFSRARWIYPEAST